MHGFRPKSDKLIFESLNEPAGRSGEENADQWVILVMRPIEFTHV